MASNSLENTNQAAIPEWTAVTKGWCESGCFGSAAVIEYIPKAVARAAGIGGIADLAIHPQRPFPRGRSLEYREILTDHIIVKCDGGTGEIFLQGYGVTS